MSEINTLVARPRDESMSPKALRRTGWLPAVMYGPGYTPRKIQVEERALLHVLQRGGMAQILNLTIEGEGASEMVLIREIQKHPVTGRVIHADLYRVSAERPISVAVPIVLEGEAPASELGGVVNQILNELEIECLPKDLPEAIVVDVSRLTELDSAIYVRDLEIPEGVRVLEDPEVPVVRIALPRAVEEEAAEEVEAVEEEAVVSEETEEEESEE